MTSAASTAAVCHVLSARSAAVCHALSTSRNGESAGTREWRGGGRDGGVPASCSTAAVSSQWGSACGGVGEANRRFGSGPRGAIPAGIVDAQDNCISVSMSQLDVVGGGDSRRGLCIRPACRTRNRSSSSLTNTEVKGLRLGSLRRSVQRNALQENSQSDGKGEVSGTGNDSVQPAPSGQQSSRSQQDGGVETEAVAAAGSGFVSEFKVDMMCEGCVNGVTRALQSLEGVHSFEISLKDKLVKVKGTATVESLEQSFSSVGRTSELLSQMPI
ncbi:hypothetical protein CBR_g48191 [Chara braunii]|uniref:HMA domain-containing protein n=1 Tax=Chara braunii TaxID=69332 RepID=A0A388M261_CHABU|nr:hypothetical protein CBR_g48191 [Chara braunii]|eukprot:GBG88660.1 hypothetical protein CBR_g48191 [Chara braunii]